MNARHGIETRNARRTAGQDGFTIIEMVIVAALGLLLMLSVAYLSGQLLRTSAQTFETNDLEDNKATLNEVVETDFHQTGNYLVELTPEAATSTTYADEVLADSPLFYWRLNESAGSTRVEDSSPHAIGGTITGTVNFGQTGALTSDSDYAVSMGAPQQGPVATNLAQGKPAFQSSDPIGGSASRAVDGNTDGDWSHGSVTHTNADQYAYWYVDLGSIQQISTVKIWNRTDCCQDRLSNFYVFAFDQLPANGNVPPSQIATLPTFSSSYVAGQAGTTTTVTFNRAARYVAVQLSGTNYLSLAEVQVFSPGTVPTPGGINSDAFTSPPGDFSVEWWLNPTRLVNYNQVITDTGWGTWVFHTTDQGSVFCGTDNWGPAINPSDVAANTLRTGQWHHLVFTYRGSTGTLYLNGKVLASKTLARPQNWTHLNLSSIDGSVDEVALYNSALSVDRLRAHYVAGVAPPIPQNRQGAKQALLPLVSWRGNGNTFQRPAEIITTNASDKSTLLLWADDQFSPVATQQQFIASSGLLTTRAGTRAEPHGGDYLLVADYEGNQSVLLRVTGPAQTSTGADGAQLWTIPVAAVSTDAPAWGSMASAATDISATFPSGATVVRMAPPVVYSLVGQRLVRTTGTSNQTLALGLTRFSVQKNAASAPLSWTVDYQLESEQIETSNDPNYKQLATANFKVTPNALNPSTR